MGIVAGILLILMGLAHNIFGEWKQIPTLKALKSDPILTGSIRVMIFQGGFITLAVGIVQLLDALHVIQLTGISQYFPVGIVIINFSTALILSVSLHRALFKITLPQFSIFVIIICLQLLYLQV